jgi:hypothetical protein
MKHLNLRWFAAALIFGSASGFAAGPRAAARPS